MEDFMKKANLLMIPFILYSHLINAEQFIDKYKKGSIVIQPESQFEVNQKYLEKMNIQNITNIALDGDDKIYLLNRHDYSISVFDQNGRMVNRFDLDIKKSASVYHHVNELCILDNKYILVRQYANILVLDMSGKMMKTINFDYPLYDFVALQQNKIGLKGFVQMQDSRIKWHIAIFNIETEQEAAVAQFITDNSQEKEFISFEVKNRGLFSFSNPKRRPKIILDRTLDGHLIVGNTAESVINIYSDEGKLLNRIALNYSQMKVNQSELDEYCVSLEKTLSGVNAPDSLLERIQSPDFYYHYLPYYYDIMVDSEGNILVFKYSQNENHSFRVYQVYSLEGQFICECQLESGQFALPNLRLLAFGDHYLYGVFDVKNDNNRIRLVKAELK
jgi:hypothetical protein